MKLPIINQIKPKDLPAQITALAVGAGDARNDTSDESAQLVYNIAQGMLSLIRLNQKNDGVFSPFELSVLTVAHQMMENFFYNRFQYSSLKDHWSLKRGKRPLTK